MVCQPVQIFFIVILALVLSDLYFSQHRKAYNDLINGFIGIILLHVLCVYGFESVSWLLLLIPVFFVLFFFVVSIYQRFFKLEENCDECDFCKDECEEERKDDCKPIDPCKPKPKCD
jgi:phosphotransferase system  glucose/maltose/N-acetylglucosamine-specific IIC component